MNNTALAARRLYLALASCLALAAGLPSALRAQAPATSPPSAPQALAEVTKVDRPAGRLSLKHGELKHLGMPAMTMAWRVRDPLWLDMLNPGDRVRFTGERIDGQFTVTSLSKQP